MRRPPTCTASWATRESHRPTSLRLSTLEWINWFNYARLHSEIGDIPPAELEAAYYDALRQQHLMVTN